MSVCRFNIALVIFGLQFTNLLIGGPASATYRVSPKAGNIEFLATGKPGFLKIKGTKAAMSGEATMSGNRLQGEFEVPLDQFDTGIELRDEHMKKKYLETSKYPKAILKISPITLDLKGDAGGEAVKFQGDLTLHGVTKPIQGDADIEWTKKSIRVKGRFTFMITDFNIDIPSYLGVKVADSVAVSTDFTTTRP